MAYFAQLDEDNIVVNVIKVEDSDCLLDGIENEETGIAFCNSLIPGIWIQTSYNDRIRKNYAGIGYSYDSELDAFIPPRPFLSWEMNDVTCRWEPPYPKPEEGFWRWNEETLAWEAATQPPDVR
jgi:hypothetical protein